MRAKINSATQPGMERGLILSILFHAAVILFSLTALPHFRSDLPAMPAPVIVDVVPISDITNLPPLPSKPAPVKTESKSIEPEIKKTELPPPVAEKLPEPAPTPKISEQPKAEKPPPIPEMKKPDKKDRPNEADFDSVLKTVEKFKPKESASPTPPAPDAQTKSTAEGQPFIPSLPISISEMDAVRRQIEACWNLPAGARNPEDLIVHVAVALNPDGTLQSANVVDDNGRSNFDPYYRAAAESAIRALLNPRCTPLKLPPEKYPLWKNMTINFDPRNILGL